jgi:hypothetical protein
MVDPKTRGAHMRLERKALKMEEHARHQCLRHIRKVLNQLGLCDSKVHSNGSYDLIRDAITLSRENLQRAEEWLGKAVKNSAESNVHYRKQLVKEEVE